jgi:hypothetical protein
MAIYGFDGGEIVNFDVCALYAVFVGLKLSHILLSVSSRGFILLFEKGLVECCSLTLLAV